MPPQLRYCGVGLFVGLRCNQQISAESGPGRPERVVADTSCTEGCRKSDISAATPLRSFLRCRTTPAPVAVIAPTAVVARSAPIAGARIPLIMGVAGVVAVARSGRSDSSCVAINDMQQAGRRLGDGDEGAAVNLILLGVLRFVPAKKSPISTMV